ncbi:hypothetical protein AT728_08040 [Streptomyces silvensis]|uniref:Uncharacterized protein n=2 Tax=Streptomyces silvensis TaxID=1765722 RepID=A0A0W7X7M5_9ACTN|nr:hypothetical protein AT728_08040 [Streptomyces silvensis]
MTPMHRHPAALIALAALAAGPAAPATAASAPAAPATVASAPAAPPAPASAPAAPPTAGAAPAGPDRVSHAHTKSVLFDTWFNGQGYSPTLSIQFGAHRYTLKADCDSDALVGQLYHSATGVDPRVGSAFKVSCDRAPKTLNYQLRGGFYYFHFISGVDNTNVVADGA